MPARSDWWPVVIAVAGGLLIGFAVSTLAYRYGWLRVPGAGILQRMDRELNLTAAQHDQIADILQDARFRQLQLQRQTQRERGRIFVEMYDQIRNVLGPKQKSKFDRDFLPPRVKPYLSPEGDNSPPASASPAAQSTGQVE